MIKALHTRPDPAVPAEECALKISVQPIKLNIDQVSYLFMKFPQNNIFSCVTLLDIKKNTEWINLLALFILEVNNSLKSDNIDKKIDIKVIQAEGEIYWETKSTL